MSIEVRKAESAQMQKNIRTVKRMTRGMCFDENMGKVNWRLVRIISNFGYKFMPKEKAIKIKKVKFNNVKCELVIPDKLDSENVILYIHGGGFVSGSAQASRGYSSMLAVYSGCKVVSVNYSLAPSKPFPFGFDDCYNAYLGISKAYPTKKIALAGESAGANLCLAVALKAKDNGFKNISSVIVHSPFIEFTGKLDRSEHEIDDFTAKEGCLKPLNEIYVAGNNPENPYISPYYGDFSDFPPTFITCDYNETLYADSIFLYRKLEQAGTEVRMIQMKGAFHAFATTGTQTPETKQILKENIEFIKANF